jgi:hypothetical protein
MGYRCRNFCVPGSFLVGCPPSAAPRVARSVPAQERSSIRSRRRIRPLLVLLIVALVIPLAGPAAAAPPSVPSFGPEIDAYARYDGQSQCLNTEQPGVVDFRSLLQRTYGANSAGILRSCGVGGVSEHKEGRAYDWMVNVSNPSQRAQADELIAWLLAPDEHGNANAMARRFGIMYIVWNRQSWKAYRPTDGPNRDGWVAYNGANPHTDHVHFSFSWDGARQRTSYWSSPSIPTSTSFSDVPRNSYYADPVAWMVGHEITNGFGNTGEFRPHTEVTRAQMAAFLWRMMDQPTGYGAHGFPDVSPNSYYEQPVRWLKATGITNGYGHTGRFEPDLVLTRGEMAEFLYRTVGRPTGDARHTFSDVSSARFYDQAVSWMVAHEITNGFGTTGRFEPDGPVTRAQNSAFLYRLASDQKAWRNATRTPSTTRF